MRPSPRRYTMWEATEMRNRMDLYFYRYIR
jgi:hypothetical protein